MKNFTSIHLLVLILTVEISKGVIYLKRQRRKSDVNSFDNKNITLFMRTGKSNRYHGIEDESGSGEISGSGIEVSYHDGRNINQTSSLAVERNTLKIQNENDLIDASLEQLFDEKQDAATSASWDNHSGDRRSRGSNQNEVSSGFGRIEKSGSGQEDVAVSSGFSEDQISSGYDDVGRAVEGNDYGHRDGNAQIFSDRNKFVSTISKRSLESSNQGMTLLQRFFEMNSNEDDELENILKNDKRDVSENEAFGDGKEAISNEKEANGNEKEAIRDEKDVVEDDSEVKMRKRSVEDLGDETLPNLSYIKGSKNKGKGGALEDKKVMKKRDVLDADNSVRYLGDVMTRDLLTDDEFQMIERITRGVQHDGKSTDTSMRNVKTDDASIRDSKLHVTENDKRSRDATRDSNKKHSESRDFIVQKQVVNPIDKASNRINKRDSFSDLGQPINKKNDKHDVVKETIDGIRNKRREILDNIQVRAPHFGLLQKRDLILDTDADADIFMANTGKTKYDIKEKRFIRTDDSMGPLRRPDRRYASFISDKITDLTPLNNEYLENMKRQNILLKKNSKPENIDLPLIGTYAKPTQVSGIWSGLGSKPVFIEKDNEQENGGSGMSSEQNTGESGSGSDIDENQKKNKMKGRHFRAEEIGNIMSESHQKKKSVKNIKISKKNNKKDDGTKRGKRMDKEEDKRYDVDQGNSQIILAFDEIHEILPKKKKFLQKPTKPTKKQPKTTSLHKGITKKVGLTKSKKKETSKEWNEDSKKYDDEDWDSGSGEESGDEETEKHVRSDSEDDVTVKTLSANYKKNEEIDKRDLIIVKRAPNDNGYLGCFVDVLSPVRDLSVRAGIPFVTINNCRSACKRTGYYYAGLQFGYLCFCGNSYGKYDMAPDSECNYVCSGSIQQTCGGLWRNSVYSTAGSPDDSKEGPIPIYLSPEENANSAPLNTTIARRSDIPSPVSTNSTTSANINSTSTYQQGFQELHLTGMPQNATGQSLNYGIQNQNQTAGVTQGGKKRKVLMHFAYLHPQHDSKVEPTSPPSPTPPLRIEPQTRVFKGEIKLKQKWFDQFRDKMSTKSQILAGNVEQALRNIYTNNTKYHDFLKAEVLSFKEGIIRNNPDTVRKVIVEFTLTFNQNAISPDAKLFSSVRTKKRLDEMPVYANTLKVAEYRFDPNSPNQVFIVPVKEPATNVSEDSEEERKSFIPLQNIIDNQPRPFYQPLTGSKPSTQGIKELQSYLSAESNARTLQNEAAAVTQNEQTQTLQQQLESGNDSESTENTALSQRADVPNMEEKRKNVPYILRLFFWKDMLARKKRLTTNEGINRTPLTRARRGDLDIDTSFDGNNNNESISKINKMNSELEKDQQPLTKKRSLEKRLQIKTKRKTKDLTTEKELKRSKRRSGVDSEFE